MQKSISVYNNLGYWFLALIVLVFAGFYSSYISILLKPQASIIHIHFILMSLWIVMLITQPFLIKYKKRVLHRKLGKVSYVLVPLVLISAFFMIRFSYYNVINDLQQKSARGINNLNYDQILKQAATFQAIAIFYLAWFVTFYSLAIINRRKTGAHARYMLATALALLGPTLDRIIFFRFKVEKLPGSIPIEVAAFMTINFIVVLLLWQDYKNRLPTKALLSALLIYILGQVLYFTIPGTVVWKDFVRIIMKPIP